LILTILSFIFVLGIVVFFHELGHFIAAKLSGVRVLTFSIGFPPKMIGFKKGDTNYCISWIPLGGYVKMAGENPMEGEELGDDPGSFMNKPAWKKAIVYVAGPLANYLTALIIASGLYFTIGKQVIDPEKVIIGKVEAGFPAEKTGLREGDILRSIDGKPIVTLTDLQSVVFENPESEFDLSWERDGLLMNGTVSTVSDTGINIKGENVVHGRIGIWQKSDTVKVGAFEAVAMGSEFTWKSSVAMIVFVKKLITGEASRKLIGGPIAIAKYSGQKAREGFASLLDFIVLISINLTIINLLPIPILDGGHLFLLGFESIRRKPLSLKQKAIFQQVGLAFILALILLVSYNDIFGRLGH
jgi:regulator of sigma E protease